MPEPAWLRDIVADSSLPDFFQNADGATLAALIGSARRQGHPYSHEQRAYLRFVHDAYTELAEADPSLHRVDVTGLDPQQTHQAVLADLSTLPTFAAKLAPAA